jgi:hypothetical protein
MKKHLFLFAFSIPVMSMNAQVQRHVLVEEFTSASCGPSYGQDPGLNVLLKQNISKVVPVKYEVNWPSADVLNLQNPSQVQTRVLYYSISGVPVVLLDGLLFTNTCTNMYSTPGIATCLSQAEIDSVYNIPSPFDVSVFHTFNTAFDSVFITVTITCFQNTTLTTPLLHVALEEQEIHFTNPISSTPMKDFYNQMRKMIPSAAGTPLTSTWITNQQQVITFAVPVPTYIYNIGQISIAAWLQDDANKDVLQAGYSWPQPVAADAGISLVSSIAASGCTPSFTPQVTLKNFGVDTLTSCTINYTIDNLAPQTMSWNGMLPPNATAVISLPAQTAVPGNHTFHAFTTQPNAVNDMNSVNDESVFSFIVISTVPINYPFTELFTNTVFPPTDWIVTDPDNLVRWKRSSTVGAFNISPLGSAQLDLYNSPVGAVDELFLPPVDLQNNTGPIALRFDIAHADFDSIYTDTLDVLASLDCGQTWTLLYHRFDTTLVTAPYSFGLFIPTAAQWRTDIIPLTAFNGQSSVLLKFSAHSDFGNDLYIDNVNVSTNSGIGDPGTGTSVKVFPDPFTDQFTIDPEGRSFAFTLELFDVLGNKVRSENCFGKQLILRGGLPAGIYFYKLVTEDNRFASGKIIAQ